MQELAAGASFREVAAHAPISAGRLRIWWDRYQAEGEPGLQDRSSRPHHSPQQTPRAVRRQIVRLRARRQSALQIAATLQRPVATIVQVQRRLGWGHLPPLTPRPPVCRYERRVPGALIHLDIKKLGRIGRGGHWIQDVFFEAGVEITSPAFTAVRDGNRSTIPAAHLPPDYQPPAFGVEMRERAG